MLDIALVKLPLPIQVSNINSLSSGYNPVLLEVSCTPITLSPPQANKRINWPLVTEKLSTQTSNQNSKITSTEDIDSAISDFTTLIKTTIELCAHSTSNVWRKKQTLPYILEEINTKNRLRRDWQLSRDPALKRKLNSKIKYIKTLLQVHNQDDWDRFIFSIASDPSKNSMYRLNKNLLNKRPATHPLIGPNALVYSAHEKYELLADSLECQFTPNLGPDLPEVIQSLQEIKSTFIPVSNLHTTLGTIQKSISRLPRKKLQDMSRSLTLNSNPSPEIQYLPLQKY